MAEAAVTDLVQGTLSGMAEGGMPEVVPQGACLCQILVEAQGAGKGSGDLGNLQCMGESGTVMIPFRGKEHLHLVHQSAKALAMGNAIPVTLELGTHRARLHGRQSAGGILGEEGFVAKKLLLATKGNVFHNTSENVLKFLFLRRYTQKICKILLFRKTF
jgi:hypothetical protein